MSPLVISNSSFDTWSIWQGNRARCWRPKSGSLGGFNAHRPKKPRGAKSCARELEPAAPPRAGRHLAILSCAEDQDIDGVPCAHAPPELRWRMPCPTRAILLHLPLSRCRNLDVSARGSPALATPAQWCDQSERQHWPKRRGRQSVENTGRTASCMVVIRRTQMTPIGMLTH